MQENNHIFINLIDLKINWTLSQTNDWKDKCIASELTIYFLIDNNNLKVFSDWDCWPDLNDDISFDEYEDEVDDLKNHRFDLTRTNFKDIIKSILFMLVEKYIVCPCSFPFKDYFFQFLQIVPPISILKCQCASVFNNIDDFLRHLKPT